MSQQDRILSDLASGEWVCGSQWLHSYLYVYSQRISNINGKQPGRIESRKCEQHAHPVYEYRDTLALAPKQLEWVA